MSVMIYGQTAVAQRLGIVGKTMVKKAEFVSKVVANDMENHAKNTAPWTDQTGNARRSINGTSVNKTASIIIYLSLGVKYGPPLELGHGGRYAVIRPTIDVFRSKYLKAYKGIL